MGHWSVCLIVQTTCNGGIVAFTVSYPMYIYLIFTCCLQMKNLNQRLNLTLKKRRRVLTNVNSVFVFTPVMRVTKVILIKLKVMVGFALIHFSSSSCGICRFQFVCHVCSFHAFQSENSFRYSCNRR